MTTHLRRWGLVACLFVMLLATSACNSGSAPEDTANTVTDSEVAEETAVPPSGAGSESTLVAGLPTLEGAATVEMQVNGGTIVMELNGEDAPVTAGNFIDLVQRGVYNGVVFHRVVKSPEPFVVQGGDPQSKDPAVPPQRLGTGSFVNPETGQPRFIPLEIVPAAAETPLYGQTFEMAGVAGPPELPHTRGAVAMARSQLPDSASAQFYIALADLPFLDGSYAVFGYVTEGMDVVDGIQQGDVVESAAVTSGIENLQQPE